MFIVNRDDRAGRFLVGRRSDQGPGVVGQSEFFFGSRILGFRDTSEYLFDFGLHQVFIEITNDNNGLQIGTVPLFIKVFYGFIFEMVDYGRITDNIADGIF